MIRTYKTKLLFLLSLVLIFASCQKDITPLFSYSPTKPKAGEKIKFTNETTDGEQWNWFFDDNSSSILKSPTKTYTRPGVYDVTLRVDSNDHFILTKQIVVYDTIPTIIVNSPKVYYQEYFTVKAIIYNPFDDEVNYTWQFSEHAEGDNITNKIAQSEEVTLRYMQHSLDETITLTVNIGDTAYTVTKTVWINDVKSNSIIMAAPNEKIFSQRIFEYGQEAHKQWEYTAPENISGICVANGLLYLSDNGNATTKPSIKAISINDLTSETVIASEQIGDNYEFNNGYVKNGKLFWTDRYDLIYQTDLATRNATFTWAGSIDAQVAQPYYLAAADRLPDFNNGLDYQQTSGGIALYDEMYFWAKTGTGKGIYRFTQADISDTKRDASTQSAEAILNEYAIENFVIDHMNTKIYFVTDTHKIYICNMDGSNVTELATDCTASIAVDNQSNLLFWTTADHVMCMPLITGNSNKPNNTANIFAELANITAIAIDPEKR